jgi:glycine hydroxymethyltransferase
LSNHHLHNVAALAVAFAEMLEFGKTYHKNVIQNAKDLAQALNERGIKVLMEHKGYTESHQIIVDVTKFEKIIGLGGDIEALLEKSNIIVNRNLLPWDIQEGRHYQNPGGLRLGTSEVTRLGMGKSEMEDIAELIKKVIVDKKDPKKVKGDVIEFRKNFQEIKYCFQSPNKAYEYIKFY